MPRPNHGPQLKPNAAGIYEIRWTERGRSKRQSTGTSDAVEAADAFKIWKAGVERERDAASAMTVRAVLASYFEEHVPNIRGVDTADKVRKQLLLHFADMDPREIRPADVRIYVRGRANGSIGRCRAGNATARRELGVLVAALNHAVKEGRMKKLDVPTIELPPPGESRSRWLTEQEIVRLLTAGSERARLFTHLAYYTAARKGAVERLVWSQVDFEANIIKLRQPGERQTKKRKVPGVAMHPTLRALLEWARARPGVSDEDYVLGHPGSVRKTFNTAVRAAGLDDDVTPHVLRHTAATHMLRRKVPVWMVAGGPADLAARRR